MIKKLILENYKPFGTLQELEIRPFTLLIGKNSSGKSSLTHLISLMGNLVGPHRPMQYKSFMNEYINLYDFHNLFNTGLKLGLVNNQDQELAFSFVRNIGKQYLHKVEVKRDGHHHVREFSSGEMQEVTNNVDFVEPTLNEWGFHLSDWSYSTNYIGPIRRISDSVLGFNAANVGEVKSKGENIFDILIDSYKGDKLLYKSVSDWLKTNMDGQELVVSNLVAEFYSIDVNNGRGATIPLEEVGEGVSQVLPILVQSYLKNASDINVIEQPALHLHPAAHAAVADRLIESVVQDGKTYVVESHSANVLLALRRAVCNPDVNLSSSDVVVYFIDAEAQQQITKIEILENGDLTSWPTGVFGEGFDLMQDILRFKK